jgi:hypothetical protein
MKNNTLYKKHKVRKTQGKKYKPRKTRGKKHKPRNNKTRNSLTRRIRKTQVGGMWWWFNKPSNTTSNVSSSLGRPPIALAQLDDNDIENDSRDIAGQERLLKRFREQKEKDDIIRLFKVNPKQQQDELNKYARQRHQEAIGNLPNQQEDIDRAYEEWLANDPATLEKQAAQREFREEEEGENQYTSPSVIYNEPSGVGPSGVGWAGWDANDEATWQRHQRRAPQRRAPQRSFQTLSTDYLPTLSWYGQSTSAGYQHDGHLGENGHHAAK